MASLVRTGSLPLHPFRLWWPIKGHEEACRIPKGPGRNNLATQAGRTAVTYARPHPGATLSTRSNHTAKRMKRRPNFPTPAAVASCSSSSSTFQIAVRRYIEALRASNGWELRVRSAVTLERRNLIGSFHVWLDFEVECAAGGGRCRRGSEGRLRRWRSRGGSSWRRACWWSGSGSGSWSGTRSASKTWNPASTPNLASFGTTPSPCSSSVSPSAPVLTKVHSANNSIPISDHEQRCSVLW
jgi:hypothetical protein